MTADIGATGAPFNTQIPLLAENANIQAALRIYHYGSNTSNPSPLPGESIAGYLQNLQETKRNLASESIGNNIDLNSLIETGSYSQVSNSGARSEGSANYPLYSDGLKYAGLLEVVQDGALVYQTYTATISSANIVKYWRAYFIVPGATLPSWSSWNTTPTVDHVHDTRYFLKYGINSSDKGASTYTSTVIDSAIAVVAAVTAQKPTSIVKTIFVQDPANGNPSGAVNNDLWFW
jgi:hypothetical protein